MVILNMFSCHGDMDLSTTLVLTCRRTCTVLVPCRSRSAGQDSLQGARSAALVHCTVSLRRGRLVTVVTRVVTVVTRVGVSYSTTRVFR